jgi:hypothetical protein
MVQHFSQRFFKPEKRACHPVGKVQGDKNDDETAQDDEQPLGAEHFFKQDSRGCPQLEMIIVIDNGKGVGRKKTEYAHKQKTAQGQQDKIAENGSSLKFFVDKILPAFV